MHHLTPAFLETIRSHNLLSSVVSRRIRISQTGEEWVGCCPFHAEETPSFVVSDTKGFYHCFGCGAHGDAIRFLVEAHGLTFMAAIRKLAAMAGIPLPEGKNGSPQHQPLEIGMPAKKGGGKLGRSETVTVRLDPKLNYLCELAARAQRRTKSSFIEWAIAESLKSVFLPETRSNETQFEDREATLQETSSTLWHVEEPDRVVALALIAPALLTHEEQLIWRQVRENGYVWRGRYDKQGQWSWSASFDSLCLDRLREKWDVFKGVALGELSKDQLPIWAKQKPKQSASFDADLDDDVPF